METIRQLVESGRHPAAVAAGRKLIRRYAHSWLAWELLSVVLHRGGKTAESIQALQAAAALAPERAEIRFNLASLLRSSGRLREAELAWRAALALKPDYVDAQVNLGVALMSQGRAGESEPWFRRALEIEPRNALAHSNLAVVLCNSGRLDEAEEHYEKAIEAEPELAGLHSNLAALLTRRGRLKGAEAACRRALELTPGLAEAWNNLGLALQAQGRNREAVETYRRAIAIKDYPEAHSSLVFCLSHEESVGPDELFAAHAKYGRRLGSPLRAGWPRHANSRDPERRLRIGFVSGDFREHAAAFFLEPLLPQLARVPGLALYGYSNSPIEDETTARLRCHFERWSQIAGISDAAASAQIQADAIDILVDLSGHTNGNRLPLFARKPAPVQASWLGYPGTTGLEAMDYYLADRFYLPVERFADQFTEKIAHLPAVSPFLPSSESPPVNPLPALGNGRLTLGSFNRPGKIGAGVVNLWSQLLHGLPDACMVIGAFPEGGAAAESLLARFAANGIPRERLRLFPRGSMGDYLALHRQVDFCLDSFPYGGCTTTSHALWMGVPTLSLDGATAAGREGMAFLRHVGLEEFVAADAGDFVRKGLAAASNLEWLAALRGTLRERVRQSALGRPELVAEGLSLALRTMWRRWCAGLPPEAF